MVRIWVKTYGCTMNQFESECIQGMLRKEGHEIAFTLEDADLIILNSCIVKTPTENKILSKIREISTRHHRKKLIIAGCMPEIMPERLQYVAPNASLVGTNALSTIPGVVNELLTGRRIMHVGNQRKVKLGFPKVRKNPLIGIVPIEEGCEGSCSYCCTRLAKGSILSYPLKQIMKETRQALESGCKEIWFTGQDSGAYFHDSKRLPEILQEISTLSFEFNLRIGMMNPSSCLSILTPLLKAFEPEQIYKFLHLPLQAGSDKILVSMERKYRTDDFLHIVQRFRKKYPLLTLATDVIVGFPGETTKQFNETIKVLEKIEPDIVNISKFGGRPGTVAKEMLEQIPSGEIKRRSQKISKFVDQITQERNKTWLDWEGSVLITKRGKESSWKGRNFAFKPVLIKTDDDLMGKSVNVRISETERNSLIGIQK